jgi:ArsR family transcriptional regulator
MNHMDIETTLRALADPTRLRIMRLLAHMELAVGELAQVLGQSQPRVSRHVGILCDAGLAERRKEGSWVFLRSAIGGDAIGEGGVPSVGAATAHLLGLAERDDPDFSARCAQDRRQLSAIRSSREASAAAYFERHAPDWDSLRSLHCPDEPVEVALLDALVAEHGAASLGALLDVGTGTGRIAELLGPHAARVTGLDKSPDMLRIARVRLQHGSAGQFDLVQGDFTALPFADACFDTLVFHQVLHYALDPALVLAEAARVLRRGGRIAVVDFARHDHEELRTEHAHARLGFADETMATLLGEAGFAAAEPVALPGQKLTVKIWVGARRDVAPVAPEKRKTLA